MGCKMIVEIGNLFSILIIFCYFIVVKFFIIVGLWFLYEILDRVKFVYKLLKMYLK